MKTEITTEAEKLTECARILSKWHNWIATGQKDFRVYDLEESRLALEDAGFPAIHEDSALASGAVRR